MNMIKLLIAGYEILGVSVTGLAVYLIFMHDGGFSRSVAALSCVCVFLIVNMIHTLMGYKDNLTGLQRDR
jgi:hypothetical protein